MNSSLSARPPTHGKFWLGYYVSFSYLCIRNCHKGELRGCFCHLSLSIPTLSPLRPLKVLLPRTSQPKPAQWPLCPSRGTQRLLLLVPGCGGIPPKPHSDPYSQPHSCPPPRDDQLARSLLSHFTTAFSGLPDIARSIWLQSCLYDH